MLSALAEDPEPAGVAGALLNTIPVIHGAGLTAPVARRWKTQLNENAKVAAFASEMPEANHNEIEGWEQGRELARRRCSSRTRMLRSGSSAAPSCTRTPSSRQGAPVARVQARGETPVARVLSLVMLGDLASVRLAELSGTAATPVEAIESFKRSLG